jgi:ubiquinone/menaquinone biosynthesis C-methylase UbiE
MAKIPEAFRPLLGEVAWYSVILDPRIEKESERHYDLVHSVLKQFGQALPPNPRILEIASYAHTTGYRLAKNLGARVTLFEISRNSLRLGRSLAGAAPAGDNPRLVAGDFHALPFADGEFDLVYICSALHHTLRFQTVLREMMRVTAPGGLLFLENEPTARRLCFHKFRSNRPEGFTPLEKRLAQMELLRTVAEPYPGSRPEQLFNMIENQTMPLPEILGILAEAGELEMLELSPEQCLGSRERHWLTWRGLDPVSVERNLLADLREGLREAGAVYSAVDRGQGFSLPNEGEVEALARTVAPELAALPANPGAPEYRYGLSCLFSAPLRAVWRRAPAPEAARAREAVPQVWPQADGIYETYPQAAQELLAQPSGLPDIQRAVPADLAPWFSEEQWQRVKSPEGIISLTNRRPDAQVRLPALAAPRALAVLRIFGGVIPGGFYELQIRCGEDLIFTHRFYASESVLAAVPLAQGDLATAGGQLAVALKPLPEGPAEPLMNIALSYAGFFPLCGELEPLARVLDNDRRGKAAAAAGG